MELHEFSAHELLSKISSGEVTAAAIVTAVIRRIKEVDPKVNAYARREELDGAAADGVSAGMRSMLKGLPVSIKDNICTIGLTTQCCSKILEGFRPPYDATVISKLKSAGASILPAKTNMDEFAFGSSTENSFFGPSRNPWDVSRVPGGSSGGSAAAVAAREAIWALGSDTGGSIRQPAAFCGVVGMKPTYGRVSRYGLIAFASSLDQIGPITRDVEDCAHLLQVIAGYDEKDSTSADVPVPDYRLSLGAGIKGMRIGIPKEYFDVEGLDPQIRASITKALDVMKSLGARCVDVSLPHTKYAVPVYYVVATAEASSNLARFDGVQYGFRQTQGVKSMIDLFCKSRGAGLGAEAKRRIILGTFALSHGYYDAYYLSALKVRTLIKKDFDEAFKAVDCVVTPTAPTGAFRIGEKVDDPLQMYLSDIYTISANLAGIPGISVPCGFISGGLPAGLQILGKPFAEETLLRIAHAYEQETQWHETVPKI